MLRSTTEVEWGIINDDRAIDCHNHYAKSVTRTLMHCSVDELQVNAMKEEKKAAKG